MKFRLGILAGLIGLAVGCSSNSPSAPSGGTGVTGTPVSIVSQSSTLTNTAYAPNPISIAAGGHDHVDQQRCGGTHVDRRRWIVELGNYRTRRKLQQNVSERRNICVSLHDPSGHGWNGHRSIIELTRRELRASNTRAGPSLPARARGVFIDLERSPTHTFPP